MENDRPSRDTETRTKPPDGAPGERHNSDLGALNVAGIEIEALQVPEENLHTYIPWPIPEPISIASRKLPVMLIKVPPNMPPNDGLSCEMEK